MTEARSTGQPLFFQLYVNPNREVAKKMVLKAEAAGCTGLFITVDAPQLGNREKDRRNKSTKSAAVQSKDDGTAAQNKSEGVSKTLSPTLALTLTLTLTLIEGVSKALTSFIDPSLSWKDIKWFRSITKMKIILKGAKTSQHNV